VVRDLDIVHQQWKEKLAEDYDKKKAEELARVARIEQEMWEAWERSKGVEEVVTSTDTTSEMGTSHTDKKVTRKLLGDPRYMDTIRWCVDLRCKIFGFIKHEEKRGMHGINIFAIDWDSIVHVGSGASEIDDQIKALEQQEIVVTPTLSDDSVVDDSSTSGFDS
jgi:hypothetical protein